MREALLKLREVGLVDPDGRRGGRIVMPSLTALRHAHEVREALELWAVRRAVEEGCPQAGARIGAAARRCPAAAQVGDDEGFRVWGDVFHLAVAGAPVGTTTVAAPSSPEPSSLPDATPVDRRPAGLTYAGLGSPPSGLLAYVGTDGGVYVADPRTGRTIQLTRGDETDPADAPAFAAGLAWTTNGRLLVAHAPARRVLGRPADGPRLEALPQGLGQLIWAGFDPACGGRCERLVSVENPSAGSGGPIVFRVQEADGGGELLNLRAEQVYAAWAGRDRILVHVLERAAAARARRPRKRRSPARRIGERRLPRAGLCRRPDLLSRARCAGRFRRALGRPFRGAGARPARHRAAPRAAFSPSPDGRRLAVAIRRRSGGTPRNALLPIEVFDLETGTSARATPPTFYVLGFYWAPHGHRLAYLTWQDLGPRLFNQWRVVDTDTGEDAGFAAFEPTLSFRTVATFFDQYGQTHSPWSPDDLAGRYALRPGAANSPRGGKHGRFLTSQRAARCGLVDLSRR